MPWIGHSSSTGWLSLKPRPGKTCGLPSAFCVSVTRQQSPVWSWMRAMNSTVTGNATTKSAAAGGGIGNNGGTLYAVNSIISDNYYYEKNADDPANDSVTPSDIGNM